MPVTSCHARYQPTGGLGGQWAKHIKPIDKQQLVQREHGKGVETRSVKH